MNYSGLFGAELEMITDLGKVIKKCDRNYVESKMRGLLPPSGLESTNPRGHISALVKGGKVVAYGESSLGGRFSGAYDRGRSCHSEMSVLKLVNGILGNRRKAAKYTIWNVRWNRNGRLTNSKPCLHCQKVLIRVGIKTIVFSNDKGEFTKSRVAMLKCSLSSGFRH